MRESWGEEARLHSGFIIGLPTETWDEVRKTIDFAEEINVDYALSNSFGFGGTNTALLFKTFEYSWNPKT